MAIDGEIVLWDAQKMQ